jgi:hypothetical protein
VGDDYTVHDLEGLITLINGREKTVKKSPWPLVRSAPT